MRTGPRAFLFFALAIATSQAQQYQPKNISFSGYQEASTAELLAVSGLKKGDVLSQADVQAAAQKLNATGLFAKITFRADPSDLHFDLVLADGLVPARYENFPWWSESEITSKLRDAIPIFHGVVPPESGLEQQLSSDLVKLVASKSIVVVVESSPQVNLGTGKMLAIRFHISSPPVVLGSATITGASSTNEADVAAIAKAMAGEAYSQDGTLTTLNQALRNVYHDRGFLEVATSDFTHKDASEQGGKIVVPIGLAVSEGPQYRVGKFTLSGDILMSKEDFEKRALLRPGDIASESKLRNTLYLIASPYKTRGYLRARIAADPSLHHDTPATVDYAISVTPGDVFHMGKLTLENLTDVQKAQFLKVWKMTEGDVYDATYPPVFLKRNADALHALDGVTASYKQFEHEDTHVVDLVVTFRKLNS